MVKISKLFLFDDFYSYLHLVSDPDPDPNPKPRVTDLDPAKVTDPYGSGFGSTTP
jgi:hypothetical protein